MKYAKLMLIAGFLLFTANSTPATGPLFCARIDFSAGSGPWFILRAVLAEDLNGDSQCDLAIGISNYDMGGDAGIRIFTGDGEGLFHQFGFYGTNPVIFPSSMFSADIDGDSDTDLVVGGSSPLSHGYVYILMNNGDGTFQYGDNYSMGQSTPVVSVFSADFDGDNDNDIAAACSPSQNPGYLAIMFNNGDGTFMPPVNYEVGQDLAQITSADLDGDGDYDLAAARSVFGPGIISVSLNNGDGTFQTPVTYAVGDGAHSIISADFDGDGDFDLITDGPDSIYILINYGNGAFEPAVNYVSGGAVHSVTAADFDGDNDLDLTITHGSNAADISVILNCGDGTFQDPINYYLGALAGRIVSADFNGDNSNDLAMMTDTEFMSVLLNNGNATFQLAPSYDVADEPSAVFSEDFNGDTYSDLVVANETSDNISVLINEGGGTFLAAVDYNVGNEPSSVFSADFDGDLDKDMAVANYGSDDVSILLNNGNGAFQNSAFYNVGDSPGSIFSADLDNDNDFDLAVANFYPGDVSILLNNGDGTFQNTANNAVTGYALAVFLADFDSDNDQDVAVGTSWPAGISIFLNNGNGTFQPEISYTAENQGQYIYAADFDGDSDYDIATIGGLIFDIRNLSILMNNGDGTFQQSVTYPVDFVGAISSADYDGDNDMDLAITCSGGYSINIYSNNGEGTFQYEGNYGVGYNPSSIFSADFDGDNDYDLAVANAYSDNVSILINLSNNTDIPYENIPVPDKFSLYSYPNPFNAFTIIEYSLPSASNVTITIYNILGRRVETLVQGQQQAGHHRAIWDASNHSSGLYIYRIKAGENSETRKMLLLR